jgi:hypothetical protein
MVRFQKVDRVSAPAFVPATAQRKMGERNLAAGFGRTYIISIVVVEKFLPDDHTRPPAHSVT